MEINREEIFISKDKIKKIHDSSLLILSEVGVKITHPYIRSLLLDSGAKEKDKSIILIPPSLVESSIKKAPSSFFLEDLEGNKVEISPRAIPRFWTGNAIYYFHKGERKEITRDLYLEFCKIADQLSNVHAIVGTNLSDFPPESRDFVGFRVMAENTKKHLRPVIFTSKGINVILEMSDILLKGKSIKEHPIFSLGFTIVSPLHWSDLALEVFRNSSGYGIPLMINSEVISGATGPVTLAGTLALANAEALSGVTIVQLLEPGRPVIFNLGFSHTFDMKTAETLTGAPEGALLGSAGSAIAHYHLLPSASWMSTDSKIPDSQGAYEKTLLGFAHAMGGVNIIWGIGNLEFTLSLCPEQAVIDNEIVGGILRVMEGFNVNEESIAISLIKEIGHKAGYLQSYHTLKHFRKELMITDLLSRERWAQWEMTGGNSILDRAVKKVNLLLKSPPSDHLEGTQREKLKQIEKKWLEKIA